MNKKEFISELKSKLSILKKEEVNDIVNGFLTPNRRKN